MLDKSVPYADVLMMRRAGTALPDCALADGYHFVDYRPGDEKAWARIETAVLEFNEEMDALLYFQKEFLPYAGEAQRRCIFIETAAGEKVANASAWWCYMGARRVPCLHWVAVHPRHQGKGLGKAIVCEALRRMVEIEDDRDFYLHTQTWSHKAIKIYKKAGFSIIPEMGLSVHTDKNYAKALAILRAIDQSVYGK